MSNRDNLIAAMREAHTQAIALREPFDAKGEILPEEISLKVDGFNQKFTTLRAQLDVLDRMSDQEKFFSQPAQLPVALLGGHRSTPTEGATDLDEKSWVETKFMTPWGREVTYRQPIPVKVLRAGKDYQPAFEAYARYGEHRVGPNDMKTLSEGVDTAGGFLVPVDYQAELIKKLATMARIRSMARIVTTSRDLINFPRVNYGADNKYTSGVRLTWTGEAPATASTSRVTDPLYGQIAIPVHTSMASMPVSNDLVEDAAFDVLGDASQLMAEAFALGEDDVFINGTGVGKPMGLLAEVGGNGPSIVKSGTSAQIFTTGDAHQGQRLNDVYYQTPAQYRGRGVWLGNSGTVEAIENLVDAQKRPIIRELTAASMAQAEPVTLKGKPIIVDEFMPDLGASSYPLVFGDFSGYLIVDRVGFSIQRLNELYAETNLQLLLARKRVGGYCIEPWRFRVMQAAS